GHQVLCCRRPVHVRHCVDQPAHLPAGGAVPSLASEQRLNVYAQSMSRRPAIARGARTNVALMALLAAAFLTGWLAFALATAPARWSLIIHAAGGFAILALLPWKSIIARRGARRAQSGAWASLVFAALVLVSLVA